MSEDPASSSPLGRILRVVALALVVFAVGVAVFGLVLVRRGRAAMQRSDVAFHDGDLRTAVTEAKVAGLSYVPGAAHVTDARARLEAVARGAESEGRFRLARAAWDALRLVEERTAYPGRGSSSAEARAREALRRLDQRRKLGEQD